jgi:hypothetical protein
MSPAIKYTFRFIGLILVQYVLSQQAPLGRFITPYMYFIFILWLPFGMTRFWLMALAMFFGLSFDYLVGTPGIHAAACVLIAYLRPFLINLLLPREASELSYTEPSVRSLGLAPYVVYAVTLTLVHHCYLVFLQWLQVGSFGYFFVKVIMTSIASLVLIAIFELLFSRKQKTRSSFNQS